MSGLIHERTPEQVAVDAEVLARVKRGIALLEERYGPTWVDQMRLEDLQLSDESCCVLGQIYGAYERGCDILEIDSAEMSPATFGFDVGPEDDSYDPLQRAWEAEIGSRR